MKKLILLLALLLPGSSHALTADDILNHIEDVQLGSYFQCAHSQSLADLDIPPFDYPMFCGMFKIKDVAYQAIFDPNDLSGEVVYLLRQESPNSKTEWVKDPDILLTGI